MSHQPDADFAHRIDALEKFIAGLVIQVHNLTERTEAMERQRSSWFLSLSGLAWAKPPRPDPDITTLRNDLVIALGDLRWARALTRLHSELARKV